MKHTFSDGTTVDVEIIRKKNKNLYFRFKSDLVLYVTAPMYISVKEIKKLIDKNDHDLLKMYERQEQKVKDDELFLYLGKKYYIKIDENNTDVRFEGNEVIASSLEDLDEFTEKEIQRVFSEEVELLKNCFSTLPDFTLKYRTMSTRWGVCNTKKKTITLNKELIKKDVELIDYVIIHEMCHFFEANHSKKFWHLVSLAYPNYKEARKRLRD